MVGHKWRGKIDDSENPGHAAEAPRAWHSARHGIQLSYQLQPMAGDKSLPARRDLSMLVSYWTLERTKSSGTLSHR